MEIVGVEPTTPCLQSRCSSQLSYTPVLVFSSDNCVSLRSSVGHYHQVTPSFLFRLSRKTSKTNFGYPSVEDPFLIRGCKGRHYFLISKSFFKNFSIFISLRQSSKELSAFSAAPLSEWECKGTTFFFTSKSFLDNDRDEKRS